MTKYDIATSMNSIMTSPGYQAVFTKPQFNKTAAKKDEKDAKGDKDEDKKSKGKPEKAEEKGKGKVEKKEDKKDDKGKKAEKPEAKKGDKDKSDVKDGKKNDKGKKEEKKEEKGKKEDKKDAKGKCCKKASQYQACVMGLAKISEILDDVGLEKSATYALLALDGLVKAAQYTVSGDGEHVTFEPEKITATPPAKPQVNTNKSDCDMGDADANDMYSIPASQDKDEPDITGSNEEAFGHHGGLGESLEPIDFPLGEQWLAELNEEALNPKNSPMARMIRELEDKKEKKDDEEDEVLMENVPEEELIDVAGRSLTSLQKLAAELEMTRDFLGVKAAGKKDPKAEVRNKPDAIFGDKHPKVKDNKDHFPIDTIGRARNALARVQQFDSAPPWWKGSLEELQKAVSRAVKKKYPSINIGGKDKKKD